MVTILTVLTSTKKALIQEQSPDLGAHGKAGGGEGE